MGIQTGSHDVDRYCGNLTTTGMDGNWVLVMMLGKPCVRVVVTTIIGLAVVMSLITIPPAAQASIGEAQRIAFLDRQNNIWVSQTDGTGAQQLTTIGGFGDVQWSHDGTRLIATGPYSGSTGVYVFSPEPDFESRSLSAGHSPVWSPDNRRVAFIDGDSVHVFTRGGDYVRSAAAAADSLSWSPDGRRIAFVQELRDPFGVGCPVNSVGWIDADSGEIDIGTQSIGPVAWSGDGDRIIYVSAQNATIREYSIASDASRFLSNRVANPCRNPFMTAPDGQQLIFLQARGDERDLVVIDLPTSSERVFSNVPVRFPARDLPRAYLTVDQTSRYVYLSRSYPTDIHRLDLHTGQIDPIVTGDWRQLVGISPDGQYYALLNVPTGRPLDITIRDTDFNERKLENVGWLAWQPSPINDSAANAWNRTQQREDRPVAAGTVSRTWLWGPEPFDVKVEQYDETPGGFRAVRYYDKSRMEITHPSSDRSSQWYVTNGLLVRELITGQMQVGDSRFIERSPSQVPVAGDPNDPNSPTYATLNQFLDAPAISPGSEITARIDRVGLVDGDTPDGVFAEHLVEETGRTVADVFWDYLNSSGPVWDGEEFDDGRLFNPTFFATGFPITEAYWTTVLVGGNPTDVLLQCFERRCLTFTPDNPEGWQVEMGNVGRHYHTWRYQ